MESHVNLKNPEKHVFPNCCYCTMKWKKIWCGIFVVVAVALIVVAAALPPYIHSYLHSQIIDQLVLDSPSAQAYNGWVSSFDKDGDKETFSTYFFHVVNPLEVLNGEKPYLQEMGPYCYNEIKIRFNVSFINDSFVQYKEWEYYTWNPDCSVGAETDKITTLNIPFQALVAQAGDQVDELVALYLAEGHGEHDMLFTTRSVRDLMFGYNDTMMWLASGIACKGIPGCTPSTFPGLQSNWTQEETNQNYGYTLMDSGQRDINNVQKLYAYRGSPILQTCMAAACPPSPTVPMWYTDAASQVPFATEGTQFAPFMDKETMLAVFVDDTNTALNISNPGGRMETVRGIDMLYYVVANLTFMNATQDPSHKQFDMFGPFGFFNATRIEHGMPSFLTNPHFYGSGYDPSLYFTGDIVIQDYDKHQTFVWVEPTIGKTLKAYKRLQVSVGIHSIDLLPKLGIHLFAKVPNLFFPVAWFEEAGELTEGQADDFKSNVYFAQNFANSIKYVCGVLGGIILALVIIWWFREVVYPTPARLAKQEQEDAFLLGLTARRQRRSPSDPSDPIGDGEDEDRPTNGHHTHHHHHQQQHQYEPIADAGKRHAKRGGHNAEEPMRQAASNEFQDPER